MQFGFKKHMSTTQCSWLVHEVANYFVQRGETVTACFMDLTKAFDKVLFHKLFMKVNDKGLPPVIIRTLIYAYQEQKGWVRLAGKDSNQFSHQSYKWNKAGKCPMSLPLCCVLPGPTSGKA